MFSRWRISRRTAYLESERLGASTRSFRFQNECERPISIYFEPIPERYVLRPGETLLIPEQIGVEVCNFFAEDGELALTFWINIGIDPRAVTIDGRPAMSWPADGKTSSDQSE